MANSAQRRKEVRLWKHASNLLFLKASIRSILKWRTLPQYVDLFKSLVAYLWPQKSFLAQNFLNEN
jgi:hypothetical protein